MRMARMSASVALSAALAIAAVPAMAQQKVLKIVPHADLRITDPLITTAGISRQHGLMVYEGLFAWDASMAAKPLMVEDYTISQDKLTYTFKLRAGLKFHDGSPVRSQDVIPSLKRWAANDSMGGNLIRTAASLDVIDDRTFSIVLKEPYSWVEYTLGSSGAIMTGIMREKDALTDPKVAVQDIVGSGPFRFVKPEWQPGNRVVYEKNPDYVPRAEPANGLAGGRLVKVDRVEWRIIPDPATAAAALAAGEVDLWDTVPITLLPVLQGNPNVTVEKIQPFKSMAMMRPNHLHPPFNDARARQALALIVNQADYMHATIGDQRWWRECFSIFICEHRYGSEAGSEPYRKQDLAKAKQLMAEAGYKGEPIVIPLAEDLPIVKSLTLVTAENLKKIGVNVDLQSADWGAVITRAGKKDPPAAGGWHLFHSWLFASTWGNPLVNIGINSPCDQTNWLGWPCDAETQTLRAAFISAPDEAARQAALDRLHRRLMVTFPYIPLGSFDSLFAWRKEVRDVLKANVLVFWNISKS